MYYNVTYTCLQQLSFGSCGEAFIRASVKELSEGNTLLPAKHLCWSLATAMPSSSGISAGHSSLLPLFILAVPFINNSSVALKAKPTLLFSLLRLPLPSLHAPDLPPTYLNPLNLLPQKWDPLFCSHPYSLLTLHLRNPPSVVIAEPC